MNLSELNEVAKYLNALSSAIRLAILYIISIFKEVPVCLIATLLNKDSSLISHHLKYLKTLGLVREKREGKFHVYSINEEVIKELLEKLKKLLNIN